MDVMSGLRSDVYRVLVTSLIPGTIGTAPYMCMLAHYFPRVAAFIDMQPIVAGVVYFILVVIAAQVVENLGSQLESKAWDPLLEKRDPLHMQNWSKYLQMAFKTTPVGEEYIRVVVLRLKFELNTGMALLLSAYGYWWIMPMKAGLSLGASLWIPGVILAVAGYLFFESYESCRVLSSARRVLVEKVTVVGDE